MWYDNKTKLAFVENLLAESEKLLWHQWQTMYPEAYSALEAIADEPHHNISEGEGDTHQHISVMVQDTPVKEAAFMTIKESDESDREMKQLATAALYSVEEVLQSPYAFQKNMKITCEEVMMISFVFLRTWMAFGGNTCDLGSFEEETNKITDLHQIHEEVLFTERGDGIVGIKQHRRDLSSEGVRNLAMASRRGRLKEDLKSST
nr:hypothetical protein AMTR_s00071p00160240 [Tanacetum cinerariifolium]